MKDSQERFSDRVRDYVRYRPGYPQQVIDHLCDVYGLGRESVVADVGSGTGIFTGLLLSRADRVFAVEPNDGMRAAADEQFGSDPRYVSVKGSADSTTLQTASVDIITVAQAFHWFANDASVAEFRRIGRPGCITSLLWNNRKLDTPFLVAYDDALKRYATDYNEVNHQNLGDEKIMSFFARSVKKSVFPNSQTFTFEGLLGRLHSSSYAPKPGTPAYEPLLVLIKDAFDQYATDGKIVFNYDTEMYCGSM